MHFYIGKPHGADILTWIFTNVAFPLTTTIRIFTSLLSISTQSAVTSVTVKINCKTVNTVQYFKTANTLRICNMYSQLSVVYF